MTNDQYIGSEGRSVTCDLYPDIFVFIALSPPFSQIGIPTSLPITGNLNNKAAAFGGGIFGRMLLTSQLTTEHWELQLGLILGPFFVENQPPKG